MKKIMPYLALIAALGVAIPVAKKGTRWFAGTDAIASRLELVEERLDRKIDKDRMNELQERMWMSRGRWTNLFTEEKDRSPESMDELLLFMDEEDRDRYREDEEEYRELREKRKPKKEEEQE